MNENKIRSDDISRGVRHECQYYVDVWIGQHVSVHQMPINAQNDDQHQSSKTHNKIHTRGVHLQVPM